MALPSLDAHPFILPMPTSKTMEFETHYNGYTSLKNFGWNMKFLVLTIAIATQLLGCATTKIENNAAEWKATKQDWSDTPDYGELRKKIGWADNYSELCESDRPLADMAEKMNSDAWDDAATLGLSWLDQCPIDMRTHFYTGIALEKSGRIDEAKNHFRWADGLMKSLVDSGDGKSPETAYITISVPEEYDALYLFGLDKKSQALVSGKFMCDQITATNKDGEEFTIYFNPSAHFVRLNKLFE